DVAPERKMDPGEKFPWRRLAEAGVSIWPNTGLAPPADSDPIVALQERLSNFGYDVQATGEVDARTKAAIAAFQRGFRPSHIDGAIDDEARALAAGLPMQLRA